MDSVKLTRERLNAELAEARKDIERLDWVVTHLAVIEGLAGGRYKVSVPQYFGNPPLVFVEVGYRAAIDAARKERP